LTGFADVSSLVEWSIFSPLEVTGFCWSDIILSNSPLKVSAFQLYQTE
jgi:hypothetical protein